MSFRRPFSLTLLPAIAAIAAGAMALTPDHAARAEEPAKPAEASAIPSPDRPTSEDRLSQLQEQGAEKKLSRTASGAADLMIPVGEGRPDPETRLLLAQNSNPPAAAEASASAQPAAPAAPATPPSGAPSGDAPAAPQGPGNAPAPGAPQGPGNGSDGGPDGGQRRGFGPPGGGFGGGFPGGGGFGGGGFGGRGFRRGGGEGGPAGTVGADGTETIRIEGDRVALQFPNNPVADILSIYEMLTGITLVKDTGIFDGATISLVTPKSVTKEEAIKLIEAALLTNGYAIVMDPGGKSARILPARTQNANVIQFSHGVQFYQSAKDLPDGETLVTYFMKLDHLAAEEAGQILANHVGLSVYGRITPVATPPGLLITESATIVKQLISIHDAIDVPDTGSSLITKFLPLTYGDAATIAQIVQATVNAQAQERESKGLTTLRGSPISGSERESSRSSSPPPPSSSSSRSSSSNQPQTVTPSSQVVADTRLNQILVVASPEDFAYISSLIAEFDKPLTVEAPYERLLKYASAVDVLPAVVDVLKEAAGGAVQLPGGGTLAVQSGQPTLSTSSTQLLAGRQTQGTRGGTVSTSLTGGGSTDSTTGTSSTGLGNRPDVIQGPQEDNAPVSVLIGKTRIIADPMANAILVMGRKEDTQKVDQLLDKLDRKPAQVYLATVIGQLTLGDDFQFGVDYLTKFGNQDGRRGTASFFASREDVITNNNITDLRDNLITSAFGPAKGFNVYGQLGDSVEAFVTALESTNKFKVLSRPSVFALNNKKATITSGQKIPYPQTTTTFANNTNGNTTSTTDYLDVVLKLEVVPLINADGEVNLTIAQVNDTVVGTQRIEPNDIPIIGTEQLITSVTVPNGNTVVLGGLISEEKKKDTEGIPYISRVPLLGNLFKENINSKTRKELIIFIQPVVVTDNNSLKQASYGEDIRTNVGKDAAERFPTVPEPPKEQLEQKDKKKSFFSRLFNKSKKDAAE